MKRIISALVLLMLCLPGACLAQRIEMDEAHLIFDYPDTYTVVSPQLALIYERLLADMGIDAEALAQEMTEQGVLSRAYNADFSEYLSIIVRSDELSEEIFDISKATDEQRRTLRSRAQSNSIWETTGLRAQDVEWQRENGEYWLYIHYTKTYVQETVGRGLRYITVHNGMYVMIDWQLSGRRFSNSDLKTFRARTHDLTVTAQLEEPMRSVTLTADIPTETTTSSLQITGKTSANATLIAEAPDGSGQMRTLSVGEAGAGGSFSLLVELPEEGTYDITLTASREGMNPASAEGTVIYSAKTLPVSGMPEENSVTTVTSDTVTLSGKTLAGVQLQLVTPFGMSKKRSGNDGSFSFELTTKDAGEYNYTLVCDKSGYDQRRISFTLNRVLTEDQERETIRKSAEKISYKNLQRDLEENRGKVMSLYGPVTEVSSSGNQTYIRMQFNKDGSGTWYNPIVIVTGEEISVRAGDMLTAVVTVGGVYEEQDASGADVMVPWFDLVFVDKVE